MKGAAALGCGALLGPGRLLHGQTVVTGTSGQFDLVIAGLRLHAFASHAHRAS